MHATDADLAAAVKLNRLRLEIERLKLANAQGRKVHTVSDGEVCLARSTGLREARYLLAK